ncbi:MAG: hypothetical protein C5B49_06810 [Bdellovibrio sp.]|nr:MAG: hypothetical protein C5B49_06810 [Bdellovibrio sp.]
MIEGASFTQLLNWIKVKTPVTSGELDRIDRIRRDYSGIRLAYAAHVEPKMISHIEFFVKRGAQLLVAPCVPGIMS